MVLAINTCMLFPVQYEQTWSKRCYSVTAPVARYHTSACELLQKLNALFVEKKDKGKTKAERDKKEGIVYYTARHQQAGHA